MGEQAGAMRLRQMFNEGGLAKDVEASQLGMFEEGGLEDEGGSIDPVSGNDVPVGSTEAEVRDDIPAQLSPGEFVLPADVVRYHGLEKIMALRDEAKKGLARMEAMGQMGNSDEATLSDDVPFTEDDIDIGEDDGEVREFNEGGLSLGEDQGQQGQIDTYGQQTGGGLVDTDNFYSNYTMPNPEVRQTEHRFEQGVKTGYGPSFLDQDKFRERNRVPDDDTDTKGGGLGKLESVKYRDPDTGHVINVLMHPKGEPLMGSIPEGYLPVSDTNKDEPLDTKGEDEKDKDEIVDDRTDQQKIHDEHQHELRNLHKDNGGGKVHFGDKIYGMSYETSDTGFQAPSLLTVAANFYKGKYDTIRIYDEDTDRYADISKAMYDGLKENFKSASSRKIVEELLDQGAQIDSMVRQSAGFTRTLFKDNQKKLSLKAAKLLAVEYGFEYNNQPLNEIVYRANEADDAEKVKSRLANALAYANDTEANYEAYLEESRQFYTNKSGTKPSDHKKAHDIEIENKNEPGKPKDPNELIPQTGSLKEDGKGNYVDDKGNIVVTRLERGLTLDNNGNYINTKGEVVIKKEDRTDIGEGGKGTGRLDGGLGTKKGGEDPTEPTGGLKTGPGTDPDPDPDPNPWQADIDEAAEIRKLAMEEAKNHPWIEYMPGDTVEIIKEKSSTHLKGQAAQLGVKYEAGDVPETLLRKKAVKDGKAADIYITENDTPETIAQKIAEKEKNKADALETTRQYLRSLGKYTEESILTVIPEITKSGLLRTGINGIPKYRMPKPLVEIPKENTGLGEKTPAEIRAQEEFEKQAKVKQLARELGLIEIYRPTMSESDLRTLKADKDEREAKQLRLAEEARMRKLQLQKNNNKDDNGGNNKGGNQYSVNNTSKGNTGKGRQDGPGSPTEGNKHSGLGNQKGNEPKNHYTMDFGERGRTKGRPFD